MDECMLALISMSSTGDMVCVGQPQTQAGALHNLNISLTT
jgi:hypothetical protein